MTYSFCYSCYLRLHRSSRHRAPSNSPPPPVPLHFKSPTSISPPVFCIVTPKLFKFLFYPPTCFCRLIVCYRIKIRKVLSFYLSLQSNHFNYSLIYDLISQLFCIFHLILSVSLLRLLRHLFDVLYLVYHYVLSLTLLKWLKILEVCKPATSIRILFAYLLIFF